MASLRHIPLSSPKNFRDLGGFPTADGKMTAWNKAYRSDGLADMDEKDWEAFKTLNVRLMIDLRSDIERKDKPVSPAYPLRYEGHSLMKVLDHPVDWPTLGPNDTPDSVEQILDSMRLDYTESLYGNLPCAVDILNLILDQLTSEDGSVVFFCSAGKDRTGIIASLLLYLCHVSDQDIIADYMVSSTYNTVGINQIFYTMPKEMQDKIPDPTIIDKKYFSSDPKNMEGLLASYRKMPIEQYLAENGFGKDKQDQLVEALTEPMA